MRWREEGNDVGAVQLLHLHHSNPRSRLPALSWDFLSWITTADKMQFYEKAAAFCVFGRGCTMLLTWMTATPAWRMWNNRKKKKKSKEQVRIRE